MNIMETQKTLNREEYFNTEAGGYYVSGSELDEFALETNTAFEERGLFTEETLKVFKKRIGAKRLIL